MADFIPGTAAGNVAIHRWMDLPERERHVPEIDRIFFTSSATQSFSSDEVREAFRERWLGRYLRHYPQWALVAIGPDGVVIGYIVASTEDPARAALFRDIAYFRDFAAVTPLYPAQLHVNLAPEWRGQGIGSRLIQAMAEALKAAGVPGVHIVTSRGVRNVRYYEANGFREVASTLWSGRDLVMLGRRLGA
jgi:GNAT superfamily N-acetyltransferase